MKNDFLVAITQLSSERNLPKEIVLQAIEQALISACKRNFRGGINISATIDATTGKVKILAQKNVVEEMHDPRTEIPLEEARQYDPMAEVGGVIQVEWTPEDFGRIDAQTAKQVFLQRIREAERDALYTAFSGRESEIILGTVQSVEPQGITVNLGKVEAALPRSEQIPTERYRHNQKLRAYIAEVNKTARGPQIILSRTHRNFLRRLFEVEVPEIFNGQVEIKAIAREPGSRSKMAVVAVQDGIDPIGACVGQRGVRIQAVTRELNGERVDIIEWHPDSARFIANSLQPAKVLSVKLREDDNGDKVASVTVDDDQLSLAIGKEGQNARLAAKLTGWRIDIKKVSEVRAEAERQAAAEAARLAAMTAEEIAAEEAAKVAEIEAARLEEEGSKRAQEEQLTQRVDQVAAPPVEEIAAPVAEPVEPVQEIAPVAAEETVPETAPEVAPSPEEEPKTFAEALAEFEAEEDEDLTPEEKLKRKADKRKRQTLVFDEKLGKVIAKKKHKSGRAQDWTEDVEEGEVGEIGDVGVTEDAGKVEEVEESE